MTDAVSGAGKGNTLKAHLAAAKRLAASLAIGVDPNQLFVSRGLRNFRRVGGKDLPINDRASRSHALIYINSDG